MVATQIAGDPHVSVLQLKDGSALETDMVVISAGIRPITEVAVNSGLTVERGIVCGDQLRTSDPDICTVDSHAEVLMYMGRFIQYYRENAKYMERSYGFVERFGIAHLRDVLVNDSQGICARLDREIEAAVAAYRDPWAADAAAPAYPAQFTGPVAVTMEEGAIQA